MSQVENLKTDVNYRDRHNTKCIIHSEHHVVKVPQSAHTACS